MAGSADVKDSSEASIVLERQWILNEPRTTNTHIMMPMPPQCARTPESTRGTLLIPGSASFVAQPCVFTIVWQALEAWTSVRPLTEFTIPGGRLPACASTVTVIAWDGVRAVLPLPPSGERAAGFRVPGLPGNETYFFRVSS